MADFDVTAPNGKKFRISAPEGATQEQVLAYAQEQFAKMPAEPKAPSSGLPAVVDYNPGVGIAETAMTLGSGMAGSVAGGIAGIAGTVLPGPEGQGADWTKRVSGGVTYQPRTKAGQKITGTVAYPFEKLAEGADYAGGAVADATGSPAAGAAVNTAIQTIPAAAVPIANAGSKALVSMGKGQMQRALKPTLEQLKSGDAARAIDTILERGINVTPGGVLELRGAIDKLNTQIMSAVQNSTAKVNKVKAAQELQGLLDRVTKQVKPKPDMQAVTDAWTDFLSHPLLAGSNDIPVQLAQELKQGTYRSLGDKAYGELKGADIEAQKTLARGLKEEIAKAVPGIGKLNAEESSLINAADVVGRRALMAGNQNNIGLGSLITHPSLLPVWLADRSPLAMSLLARLEHSSGQALPVAGNTVAAGGAAMAGRPRNLEELLRRSQQK